MISNQGGGVSSNELPFFPDKTTNQSIATLESLANALDLDLDFLLLVRDLPLDKRYKSIEVPKSDGNTRSVYDPDRRIRIIQKRINTRIFCSVISWPRYLFGSLPNQIIGEEHICRDYIECASKHCGSKSILKIDISNFFDNIHRDFVYDIFRDFLKYGEVVSEFLTDICCHGDYLIQGALTSSYIATLCFWDEEGNVARKLQRKNLVYTRLVDDITVSSKSTNFNFEYAENHIKNMLFEKDLPVNSEKRKILRAGIEPLEVHGLRVNFKTPRLPSKEVGRIRAAVHNVVEMAKRNNYRTSIEYRKMYDRCVGRVNKLARVGHEKHEIFKRKLNAIKPLPSKFDITECERMISNLERLSEGKLRNNKNTRKFYLVQYRVSIVKRTYRKEAGCFSKRLAIIKPYVGRRSC